MYPASSRRDFNMFNLSRVESCVNLQSSASSVIVFDSLDEGRMFIVAPNNSCSILPTRSRCDTIKLFAFRRLCSVVV